jgi:hypothetical protein
MAHIILFENANFHGKHKHLFMDEWNLNADDDSDFNDITSSIIVLDGTWRCFTEWSFNLEQPGEQSELLGPGLYAFVEDPNVNIANDSISSVKLLKDSPAGYTIAIGPIVSSL